LDNGRFIVSSGKKPKAILAELLSTCEFATYRNALRDLNDVKLPNSLIEEKTSLSGNYDSSFGSQKDAVEKSNDKESQEGIDQKRTEQITSQSATEVTRKIWGRLQAGGQISQQESMATHWKLGVSPEQEDEIRVNLKNEIVAALEAGPKVYFKRLKQAERINVQDKSVKEVGSTDSSMLERIVVDQGSGNPKAFLFAEYDGRCQVCGTELKLSSGKKWIDVFHIEELREGCWWGNRPFNILGLCPNCHALAKHGGGLNLTNIYIAAKALQTGDEFPVEVPMFHGDFYVVPVVIAGIDQRLVLSKIHLSHVAALLVAADEEAVYD
jgi:predicted HNH restriction endonuclease